MADGRNYGQQNLWQLEKSTYKREAHPERTGEMIFAINFVFSGLNYVRIGLASQCQQKGGEQ